MTNPFTQSLDDPNASLAVDPGDGHRTVLAAFGGIAGALGIPPFEFFRMSQAYDVARVFVRDLGQSWYHGGLPGHASDLEGTGDGLRTTLAGLDAERVVFVGNSMGGYAAMLFGSMLDVDEVLAFAPQSFIDVENRRRKRDRRWPEQMKRAQALAGGRAEDLLPILAEYRGSMRVRILYSRKHRLDRVHAERLESVPCVELRAFRAGGHGLIKALRDDGTLHDVLAGALTGASAHDDSAS